MSTPQLLAVALVAAAIAIFITGGAIALWLARRAGR